jgi:hypothetical protein
MTKIVFAAVAAAAVFMATPLVGGTALAQPNIEVGPGGVRVGGHDRVDSRRRDRSDRRGRRCVTETITRTTPSGRRIRETRQRCR